MVSTKLYIKTGRSPIQQDGAQLLPVHIPRSTPRKYKIVTIPAKRSHATLIISVILCLLVAACLVVLLKGPPHFEGLFPAFALAPSTSTPHKGTTYGARRPTGAAARYDPLQFNRITEEEISPLSAAFPRELGILQEFCSEWIAHAAGNAAEPVLWVRGLSSGNGASAFSMAVPLKSSPMGHALTRRGAWEPKVTSDLLTAMAAPAQSNTVLLDIGAGLGWFALVAAASNHSVVAVETDPISMAALRRSACANGMQLAGQMALLPTNGGRSRTTTAAGVVNAAGPGLVKYVAGQVGVVAVHLSGADSLSLVAESSHLWAALRPSAMVLVLEGLEENIGGDKEEVRRAAALAMHTMHELGYTVHVDGLEAPQQPPPMFARIASTMASRPRDVHIVWFKLGQATGVGGSRRGDGAAVLAL